MATAAGTWAAPEAAGPLPPAPQRRLDAAAAEGLEGLLAADASGGGAPIKSRDFPELVDLEVQPRDVKVVLYDANSVDSFVACYAARRVLGEGAVYEGVDRSTAVEDLAVDVCGQVVAMVGVCWSLESMHLLVQELAWLFIVETYLSEARELEHFAYRNVVRILDCEMGAGALTWNLFSPREAVPPLLRALEDAELGREALREAAAFADGFQAALDLQTPRGELRASDAAFHHLEALLDLKGGGGGGRASIARAVEEGRALAPGIRAQCLEAQARRSVRSLRAFPAWRCALANAATPFAGRVAEHLAAALAAEGGCLAAERSFGAVFEVRRRRVRVALRSPPGGPDVSEVAKQYMGGGRPSAAFFSVNLDEWEELWVRPEPVLWDVPPRGAHCLALKRGERVTVAHRGERFKESPADQWSWGYCTDDHSSEGWIPTLAHELLVATRGEPSESRGVQAVEEGDLLVARGQKGKYLWGTSWPARHAGGSLRGWFPRPDGLWQPVHPTSVWDMLETRLLEA